MILNKINLTRAGVFMSIVNACAENLKEWAEMSNKLFPELTFEEAFAECREWLEVRKEVGVLY